jgi:hypothetical protein
MVTEWITTHINALHHNTPFLHLSQLVATANAVFGLHRQPEEQIDPAERALLYAVLALGRLREQTFDRRTGHYKSLLIPSPTQRAPPSGQIILEHMPYTPDQPSTVPPFLLEFPDGQQAGSTSDKTGSTLTRLSSYILFQAASNELDAIDRPSETAVQALFLMHTYVSNTSMSRKSRDYVARAVVMAHEIGLNKLEVIEPHVKIPGQRKVRDPYYRRRRALLYLYVCFSDV